MHILPLFTIFIATFSKMYHTDSAQVLSVILAIYDIFWIFQNFETPGSNLERSASEIYKFMLPLKRERMHALS